MSELRCDPIVGQWVIVRTKDSLKPEDYKVSNEEILHQATCQFCPGREHMTPHEVGVVHTAENNGAWGVRAVPNKFPALKIEGDLVERREGIHLFTDGVGAHEVVIETPKHDQNLADLSVEEVVDVISMYRERLIDLSGDKRFKYVVIFKNYGESAGASVEHPHSQIIALPMVPKYVSQEIKGAKDYFDEHQRCVFCDILHEEQKDKDRLITQNDDFVSFCPYVSRFAFESWIMPKKHQSKFFEITDEEEIGLAQILKETLLRMKQVLKNPSYNFYLHIAPINEDRPESYHWHIEIVPKLSAASGFERGTGVYTVSTQPKLAAEYLRNVSLSS